MAIRIIPRLDVKGPNLVKGIHLEGLRVLGKPEQFARHYYEQGADELFYMDTVASLYGRNSLEDLVTRTAREVHIPLTVGGGIRTVDDIRSLLRCGADKVAINTAAIARPAIIREAAETFGSSTIVVSIEAMRQPAGHYEAYTACGRNPTGRNAVEWALEAVELGAGEIAITSIEREGTGKGFDLGLIAQVADRVPVPVIACGGAGSAEHVRNAILDGHADAICLASSLHYDFLEKCDTQKEDYRSEGNIDFLRSRTTRAKPRGFSLATLKRYLGSLGLECRELSL